MEYSRIETEVLKIVRSVLGSDEADSDTVLLGSGGLLDSVSAVGLIVRLEETFGIELAEDDLLLESLSTPSSVIAYIRSKT